MLPTKRRMTLKPMSLNVAMSSIMQILDTTKINIIGIVTPTISPISVFKSGAVKSWTMKSCAPCGSCPTTNAAEIVTVMDVNFVAAVQIAVNYFRALVVQQILHDGRRHISTVAAMFSFVSFIEHPQSIRRRYFMIPLSDVKLPRCATEFISTSCQTPSL